LIGPSPYETFSNTCRKHRILHYPPHFSLKNTKICDKVQINPHFSLKNTKICDKVQIKHILNNFPEIADNCKIKKALKIALQTRSFIHKAHLHF
jgi:hypothetical protein